MKTKLMMQLKITGMIIIDAWLEEIQIKRKFF